MIMQHKPDLIAESFETRTERECGHLFFRGKLDTSFDTGATLREYRRLIQQHIKDAKP
jgi:hypothetical protein